MTADISFETVYIDILKAMHNINLHELTRRLYLIELTFKERIITTISTLFTLNPIGDILKSMNYEINKN